MVVYIFLSCSRLYCIKSCILMPERCFIFIWWKWNFLLKTDCSLFCVPMCKHVACIVIKPRLAFNWRNLYLVSTSYFICLYTVLCLDSLLISLYFCRKMGKKVQQLFLNICKYRIKHIRQKQLTILINLKVHLSSATQPELS